MKQTPHEWSQTTDFPYKQIEDHINEMTMKFQSFIKQKFRGKRMGAINILRLNNSNSEPVEADRQQLRNPNSGVTKGSDNGQELVKNVQLADHVETGDGNSIGQENNHTIVIMNRTASRRQEAIRFNFPLEGRRELWPKFREYEEGTNKNALKQLASYKNSELLSAIKQRLEKMQQLKRKPPRPPRPTRPTRQTTKMKGREESNVGEIKNEFTIHIHGHVDYDDVEPLKMTHNHIQRSQNRLNAYGNNALLAAIEERLALREPTKRSFASSKASTTRKLCLPNVSSRSIKEKRVTGRDKYLVPILSILWINNSNSETTKAYHPQEIPYSGLRRRGDNGDEVAGDHELEHHAVARDGANVDAKENTNLIARRFKFPRLRLSPDTKLKLVPYDKGENKETLKNLASYGDLEILSAIKERLDRKQPLKRPRPPSQRPYHPAVPIEIYVDY
ncbi:jg22466 [Pararge aegeria aegeria]|uniref:Jg22466 protein n=1 Tax=Pararge aegeria aegeria TaxID=348720 RepID=A0A8S4SAE7_9NEOP|nr:jg22466 [Pararge aegeria aegeria]